LRRCGYAVSERRTLWPREKMHLLWSSRRKCNRRFTRSDDGFTTINDDQCLTAPRAHTASRNVRCKVTGVSRWTRDGSVCKSAKARMDITPLSKITVSSYLLLQRAMISILSCAKVSPRSPAQVKLRHYHCPSLHSICTIVFCGRE
jgi:hypothetical protein